MKGECFKLVFSEKYFQKDINYVSIGGYKVLVLSKPKRQFFRVLLQYITFGLYKAPYNYKVYIA